MWKPFKKGGSYLQLFDRGPDRQCRTKNTVVVPLLILCMTGMFVFVVWYMSHITFVRHDVVNATCLDGSPAVYYTLHRPNPGADRVALVYLQGGGWCFTSDECTARAQTPRGSSRTYPRVAWNPNPYATDALFGRLPPECAVYMLPYCDGGSWFGRDTLARTLDTILRADNASRVVLAGCSAGGLAVMHACGWARATYPDRDVRCATDGSLWFGDMRDMIEYHHGGNVTNTDAVDVVRTFSDDGVFFIVDDLWNWDFVTSDACRRDAARCTATERAEIAHRRDVVASVGRRQHVWLSEEGYHCQLGIHVPDGFLEALLSP